METCINFNNLMLFLHKDLLYKLKKQMYYLIKSFLGKKLLLVPNFQLEICKCGYTKELGIRNSFSLIQIKYLSEGLESDTKHFADANCFVFDYKIFKNTCLNT